MKIRKGKKIIERYISIFIMAIMLFSMIPATFAETIQSTSISNVQSISPSISNPYSSAYPTLQSGPFVGGKAGEGEYFDLMVGINPLDCSPAVVRSDLLEERNVPVFCKLSALKVNPGVDISRIGKINTRLTQQNPYIVSGGLGFYPAQAAIKSRSSLMSSPVSENLGYVVVVLKKQESERTMPDKITAQLSATLEYDTKNSFGLGQTEFYVPVMTDTEFENRYKDYGFWNGIGYLRAEEVQTDKAVVSVYSSDTQKIASINLEKGKTSDNIFIPLATGGKGIKMNLQDTGLPETNARIKVNGDEYMVYKNGLFADGRCRLSEIISRGAGTGTVDAVCEGKKATLSKSFGKILLNVGNTPVEKAVGDEITAGTNGYLVYVGLTQEKGGNKMFAMIASSTTGKLSSSKISAITEDIASKLGKKTDPASISSSKGTPIELIYEGSTNSKTNTRLAKITADNSQISEATKKYYQDAIIAYDNVISRYPDEKKDGGNYEQFAMCSKYLLARELKQEVDKTDFLLQLVEKYPEMSCDGKSAKDIFNQDSMYTYDGSTKAVEEKNIYLELVSINQPLLEDASVQFDYTAFATNTIGADSGKTKTFSLRKGEKEDIGDNRKTIVTLVDFTENTATVKYECKDLRGVSISGSQTVESGRDIAFETSDSARTCNGEVTVGKINYNRVAKLKLTPNTAGKSRETNFTFSIGIEKRSENIAPSPEEAERKIKQLNETIAKWTEKKESIGKLVKGMKAACLATSLYLNVKNWFAGLGGEADARRAAMNNVWNTKCQNAEFYKSEGYTSSEQCINGKANEIDTDTAIIKEIMKEQNEEIAKIETQNNPVTRKPIKQAGTFGVGSTIDTEGSKQLYVEHLKKTYSGNYPLVQNIKAENFNYDELKEIELAIKLQSSGASSETKSAYQQKLDVYLAKAVDTNKNSGNGVGTTSAALPADAITLISTGKTTSVEYTGETWNMYRDKIKSDTKINAELAKIKPETKIAFIKTPDKDTKIFVTLEEASGKKATIDRTKYVYAVASSDATTITLRAYDAKTDGEIPTNVVFDIIDEGSLSNKCTNCDEAKFFALEPYKGMPAQIPFDKENGWYVATQQLMASSGTKTFADSGAPNTFWLCNVWQDGVISGVGLGDDKCQRIDMYSDVDSVFGIKGAKAKTLVSKARNALLDAKKQADNNPSKININGLPLSIKSIEASTQSKCTDFMSPSDCKLMFNVCDPVVCPSSRCNLGGAYTVDNVIQSGIVGSVFLCIKNFVVFGGDVYLPVCLTGIHAGMESWISILSSYRDCLQESVTTGKMVGICDEIYSVYKCDFFWKQIAPFMKVLAQNLFSVLMGQGSQGGGEYMMVQSAFANSEASWKYFTGTYAQGSNLGFATRSFAELGSEVCKAQLSTIYPNKLDTILEPESPVQIYATFDEMPFTDATVPPTSQYKVAYHIFAGNEQGHYYTIYLKNPPTLLGYADKTYSTVATGYLAQGQTLSETKDFTEVSGFKQLCVKIDTKDYCDFKLVSTDFGLNYAKDKVIEDQATTPVKTEAECVSGTPHIGNVLTPNLQQGVEETINPELYNQGITRVCSSINPGQGIEEGRWKNVGYCGTNNIICWLDEKSVKNSINGKGIETSTIEQIDKMNKANLQDSNAFYKTVADADASIKKLEKDYALDSFSKSIAATALGTADISGAEKILGDFVMAKKELEDKLIFNYQKADIEFFGARIYSVIAEKMYGIEKPTGNLNFVFEAGKITITNSNLKVEVSVDKTNSLIYSGNVVGTVDEDLISMDIGAVKKLGLSAKINYMLLDLDNRVFEGLSVKEPETPTPSTPSGEPAAGLNADTSATNAPASSASATASGAGNKFVLDLCGLGLVQYQFAIGDSVFVSLGAGKQQKIGEVKEVLSSQRAYVYTTDLAGLNDDYPLKYAKTSAPIKLIDTKYTLSIKNGKSVALYEKIKYGFTFEKTYQGIGAPDDDNLHLGFTPKNPDLSCKGYFSILLSIPKAYDGANVFKVEDSTSNIVGDVTDYGDFTATVQLFPANWLSQKPLLSWKYELELHNPFFTNWGINGEDWLTYSKKINSGEATITWPIGSDASGSPYYDATYKRILVSTTGKEQFILQISPDNKISRNGKEVGYLVNDKIEIPEQWMLHTPASEAYQAFSEAEKVFIISSLKGRTLAELTPI